MSGWCATAWRRTLKNDLEALSGLSGVSAAPATPGLAVSRGRLPFALAAVGILAAAALASFFAGRKTAKAPLPAPPSFRQLTFRRGTIFSARFAPDGQTIVYGATREGRPHELFSTRPESPEARSLGLPPANILAISSSGEMALQLEPRPAPLGFGTGTLARAPLAGGLPREVLEEVVEADWAPDGSRLAVVRIVGGRSRLEFPAGKVLFETAGYIDGVRVSPKGDLVAFLDHPVLGADDGSVAVVDLSGKKTTLSPGWTSALGLAWPPSGEEVWFTATKTGTNSALYAVTLSGKERLVARAPGRLRLHDISRQGRVLLAHDNFRIGIAALGPGESKERDLSWLDRSIARDLSADGKTLLFSEHGEGGGPDYSVYLRGTDGSPALRLGEGGAEALSPDGKWALSLRFTSPPQLVLLPARAGDPKPLERGAIEFYHGAAWLPDGKRILFTGNEPGRGARVYLQDIAGGKPRAITPEGTTATREPAVSPDGKFVAALDPERKVLFYPIEGGGAPPPRPVAGLSAGDRPVRWSGDGRSFFFARAAQLPYKLNLYRLDLSTHRKEPWKEITCSDPTGILRIYSIELTPDGRSYAYTYIRALSDLYLGDGLR